MRKIFSNKKLAAVAVAAVAVTGTGVAYAFWTTGGTGDGSATVGSDSPVTVVASPDEDEPALVPGGPSNELQLKVTNPNSYHVSLEDQTVTIDEGSIKCDTTSVPDAWFVLVDEADKVTTDELAAPAGATDPTDTVLEESGVEIKMVNDSSLADEDENGVADGNQNVCKDATVSFDLTVEDPTPAP